MKQQYNFFDLEQFIIDNFQGVPYLIEPVQFFCKTTDLPLKEIAVRNNNVFYYGCLPYHDKDVTIHLMDGETSFAKDNVNAIQVANVPFMFQYITLDLPAPVLFIGYKVTFAQRVFWGPQVFTLTPNTFTHTQPIGEALEDVAQFTLLRDYGDFPADLSYEIEAAVGLTIENDGGKGVVSFTGATPAGEYTVTAKSGATVLATATFVLERE